MNCSISGEICETPVVSPSGHIFEKRLIEKQINETGKCPITNQEIKLEDLIYVKNTNAPIKPRQASATSFPSLIKLFQNEWDGIMLETYNLKRSFENMKQDLCFSLYQHDAACRVIARLIKEREDAKNALSDTNQNIKNAIKDVQEKPTPKSDSKAKIDSSIIDKITLLAGNLSKVRKKSRKNSNFKDLASIQDISDYTCTFSEKLRSKKLFGFTCIDINSLDNNKIIMGKDDSTIDIYDRKNKKKTAILKSHTKKVSDILFHPTMPIIISSSFDNSSIVWKKSKKNYSVVNTNKSHFAAVTSISLHATKEYYSTASMDSTWAFHDLDTGKRLSVTKSESEVDGISCIDFHPDGLLLGTGGYDNIIKIWDIKTLSNMAPLKSHKSPISSLSFSENGYYLSSSDVSGVVKLWDLRKPKNIKTLTLKNEKINKIKFDRTGSYLGIVGNKLYVYYTKTWEMVRSFDEHSKDITGLVYDDNMKCVLSCSLDGTIKSYGKSDV